MTLRIPRRQYADLYGPTTGDRVRLADTDLLIRIERDLTVPGEEAKFGGGKVIRDGMGQSARATRAEQTLATEEHARRLGRSTLVLDTRAGDPSERLYVSVGWQRVGEIPRFAQSAGGALHATAFYYKLLLTTDGGTA